MKKKEILTSVNELKNLSSIQSSIRFWGKLSDMASIKVNLKLPRFR